MDKKFTLDSVGNTESIIKLELIEFINIVDSDFFLKNYKISNFFKGKFFIKRLIKKVFKYKIKKSIFWDSDFWNNIEIKTYNASLEISNKLDCMNNFEDVIFKNFSSKRIKDIENLKDLINSNAQLDLPLLITNNSLNLLGAELSKNNLFMLDGSRRCMAYILNNIVKIQVYVISVKEESNE